MYPEGRSRACCRFLTFRDHSGTERQSFIACSVLDQEPKGVYNVEFGLDVVDPDINRGLLNQSRPRGRLEHLAQTHPDRFLSEHTDACIQPIRYLASLCR